MSVQLKPAQLRLLVAIDDHRQLQLAADEVALTQPAASRMLAEIERRLDASLFLRQPKGLVPTEVGTAVIRRARAALRELGAMAGEVAALKSGRAGSIQVGAVTGPALSYLVPAIRAVKRAAPEAEIGVEVAPSRELLRQLIAGRLDFVIGRVMQEFDSRDFDIQPMRDEKLALLVRAEHPLARSHAVTFTELADYEWILQERGAPIREATLAAFADAGLAEPGNIVVSSSLLLTISYLSRSNAVAAMSDEVAQLLTLPPVSAGFTLLDLTRPRMISPYYLIRLKSHPMPPLAAWLRDLVLISAGAAQNLSAKEIAAATA